jgi:hypothetical protein
MIDEMCKLCRHKIPKCTFYFRAVHDPDGRDEFGYDVCVMCKKETDDPNPKGEKSPPNI